MSATGRGAERRPDDFYVTPKWAVERFIEEVPLPSGRWLEPCAGNGAIIRAVNRYAPDVVWDAVELRDTEENRKGLSVVDPAFGDFLELSQGVVSTEYDVAITNPPYSLAQEFIERCMLLSSMTVMLLRINFLASETRAPFLREFTPDIYVLPNRPDFTGGGGDATEYAWFVFRGRRKHGVVRVLGLTEPELRGRKPRRQK